MNIFNDHKKLYITAGLLFFALTLFTVILPALQNQNNNAPLPGVLPLTGDVMEGKLIYIAEGCVGCHSQQVRNIDMDKMFGARPGMAADYAHITRTSFWQNTTTLMGTERTGPDLTDIGNRQPSKDWHLMHLYNPRSVVKQSIMPAYTWLFETKEKPPKADVVVNVPAQFRNGEVGKVIATKKALNLLAYIQSLKQAPLPTNTKPMAFLYQKTTDALGTTSTAAIKGGAAPDAELLEGKSLYASNCQSCHQPNGEGLAGAFPPLKGSKVVTGDNLKLYVDIIMNGYNAREEYGVMAAVGKNMKFTEKQVAAIINFERKNWGNTGKKVSAKEVKKIMDSIKD